MSGVEKNMVELFIVKGDTKLNNILFDASTTPMA